MSLNHNSGKYWSNYRIAMPEMRDRTLTVIGSTSVGKSALTIRFIEKKFSPEYNPTISRTYRQKLAANGIDYHLTIIDTAGLEQNAQIPMQYINSHGFILVYSIADKQSFQIVCDIYKRLIDELNSVKVPLVLIGNKSDLNAQRKISYDAGLQLAQEMGSQAMFLETSALTGEKVEDVFVTLLNLVDRPSVPTGQGNNQKSSNSTDRNATGDKKNCIVS